MKSNLPVLLLEDDEVDRMNVERAFSDLKIKNKIVSAENGEEGLVYLRDEKKERPCIILLDINMPKMDGIEFLRVIKEDDAMKMIPVVVLTTSEEQTDKVNSYNLGVAGYILKPVDYNQFVEVIKGVDVYWSMNELL